MYLKVGFGAINFLVSSVWCSLCVDAGVVVEPGTCSAEYKYMQFFSLSCSLLDYFLKPCKKEVFNERILLGKEDMKSSYLWPHSSCGCPNPLCASSLSS